MIRSSAELKTCASDQEVIDIDEEDQELIAPINKKLECYFGLFGIVLEQSQLRLELRLKENPAEALTSDDIQLIQKDQYDLTQPILLYISNSNMTKSLRKSYRNISGLAKYLQRYIGNPQEVIVAADKLILNCSKQQSNPEQVVEIYYNYFKKVQKADVIRDLRKVNETYAAISQADMEFIDPDLILACTGFSEEDLLALYGEGDSSTSQSQDSNEKSEEGEGEGDEQTEGRDDSDGEDQEQVQHRDNISFASQLEPNYHNPYQSSSSPNPKPQTFKQNQIPIWQRFRGVDTNIPRKEKIKLAEKMLRIGYSKQEIIRFFSGGAEEMQAEGNRLPDYRNPQSDRYKFIHQIVAKKQHQRHNQLLKRYSLPPVPQLPDYAGEIVQNQKKTYDRRIKQLLVRLVKEKKFKRLDEIQQEMRRHNEQVSLHQIKRHVEELKKRNAQKKQLEKKLGDMSEHNPEDDFA